MGLIFFGVLVASTVLYGSNMGWRWAVFFWALFFLGSFVAGMSIPALPFILQAGAAICAAIKGYTSSSLSLANISKS